MGTVLSRCGSGSARKKHGGPLTHSLLIVAVILVGIALPVAPAVGTENTLRGTSRPAGGGGGGTFKSVELRRRITRDGVEYRFRLSAIRGPEGERSTILAEICKRKNPDGPEDVTQCQTHEFKVPRNDVENLDQFGDVRINTELPSGRGRINLRTNDVGNTTDKCGDRVRTRDVNVSNVERFRIETNNSVFGVLDEVPQHGTFSRIQGLGCFKVPTVDDCDKSYFDVGGSSFTSDAYISTSFEKVVGSSRADVFFGTTQNVTEHILFVVEVSAQIAGGRVEMNGLNRAEADLNGTFSFDGRIVTEGVGEPVVGDWFSCDEGEKAKRDRHREAQTIDAHNAKVKIIGEPDLNIPQGDYSYFRHDIHDS